MLKERTNSCELSSELHVHIHLCKHTCMCMHTHIRTQMQFKIAERKRNCVHKGIQNNCEHVPVVLAIRLHGEKTNPPEIVIKNAFPSVLIINPDTGLYTEVLSIL